jgi:Myb-like DNA-binding domain
MVNHRGSASPLSMDHTLEPSITTVSAANEQTSGNPSTSSKVLQEPVEPERESLPTPSPSCSELDDLPAIFDLPSDVIYATVNELPKKDGSSLSQLPMYTPPRLTEEIYHNPIEELPIVPISKYCLERYIVPVGKWEPPNGRYRLSTPEHPDDVLEISKEVQVEAVPTFAPAGTGTRLIYISLICIDPSHGNRRRSSAIIIRPPAPPTHWTDQKPPPWTPEEERLLLQSAKDNFYNFELVAATMSFPGSSVSDLEKRSAWECFEKFRAIYPEPQNIQIVGPNRNAALNRLEKGNRLSVSSTSRPKANVIIRQPRLEVRNHRYLNLFDAMKKSAKNREKSRSQGAFLIVLRDSFPRKTTHEKGKG